MQFQLSFFVCFCFCSFSMFAVVIFLCLLLFFLCVCFSFLYVCCCFLYVCITSFSTFVFVFSFVCFWSFSTFLLVLLSFVLFFLLLCYLSFIFASFERSDQVDGSVKYCNRNLFKSLINILYTFIVTNTIGVQKINLYLKLSNELDYKIRN
jgi:hypothetical protein